MRWVVIAFPVPSGGLMTLSQFLKATRLARGRTGGVNADTPQPGIHVPSTAPALLL